MQKERIRAVIALLAAAENLIVMAEGEGQQDRALLRATTRVKTILNKEAIRLVKIYDEAR